MIDIINIRIKNKLPVSAEGTPEGEEGTPL